MITQLAELAALVPSGRGLSRDGLHVQVALPRIDSVTDSNSLGDGVRHLIAQVPASWHGPDAAGVRLLPHQLTPTQCRRWPSAHPSGAGRSASTNSSSPRCGSIRSPSRSRWKSLEAFVVVDDYELVATSSGNPLQPFFDLVSQAADIGLHIFLARGMGGAGRAGYWDQIIIRMRDGQHPGLIMSGPRDEGPCSARSSRRRSRSGAARG